MLGAINLRTMNREQRLQHFTALLQGPNPRIGVVHSGGPAPGANAVIEGLVLQLNRFGITTLGLFHGFKHFAGFNSSAPRMVEGEDFRVLTPDQVLNQRFVGGVMIKTSRANPGKPIKTQEDLNDPAKTEELMKVLDALLYLRIGALVTIGGDDTMRSSSLLFMLGLPTVHVPKTIDNDYSGIDWTFGFWSAVGAAAKLVMNLRQDAETTDGYFIAECMGRDAGWFTYGAAMGGGAMGMVAPENIEGELDITRLAESFVNKIILNELKGVRHGVICVAEGLVEKLPKDKQPNETDTFGHIALRKAKIGQVLAELTAELYKKRVAELGNPAHLRKEIKVVPHTIGYETRSSDPSIEDVLLAMQLGRGAALAVKAQDFGRMISCQGELELTRVPYEQLIDPATMLVRKKRMTSGSDFWALAELIKRSTYPDPEGTR